MAQRVGHHARREEHLLEDPRRCLLKSRAAVCHSPLPPPLDTLIPLPLLPSEQRHGLPLQACTRSLTGPRISISTVRRVRHDRYCGVQPDGIRL